MQADELAAEMRSGISSDGEPEEVKFASAEDLKIEAKKEYAPKQVKIVASTPQPRTIPDPKPFELPDGSPAEKWEALRDLVQAVLAHEQRADARQLPLRRGRMLGKQILRRHKAEHAVTQEFQALVAEKVCAAVLVGIGAVAQSLGEQGSAAEAVAQLTFQFLQGVSPPFS